MIRRPPRSTPFPTRRSSDLRRGRRQLVAGCPGPRRRRRTEARLMTRWCSSWSFSVRSTSLRSEEHTSELQSRLHLVCRLLLEKKKKKERTRYEQTDKSTATD